MTRNKSVMFLLTCFALEMYSSLYSQVIQLKFCKLLWYGLSFQQYPSFSRVFRIYIPLSIAITQPLNICKFLAYLYIIYPKMLLFPQILPPYIFLSYAFLNLQFLNRLNIKNISISLFLCIKI